jgi:hypothetical protein
MQVHICLQWAWEGRCSNPFMLKIDYEILVLLKKRKKGVVYPYAIIYNYIIYQAIVDIT